VGAMFKSHCKDTYKYPTLSDRYPTLLYAYTASPYTYTKTPYASAGKENAYPNHSK